MNWKFIVLLYFLIPTLMGVLAYAVLRDLVGENLAFVAGACMGVLLDLGFLNNFGKPVRWK